MDILLSYLFFLKNSAFHVLPFCLFLSIAYGINKLTLININRSFGWKAQLPLAVIGVPIHEISHAVVAKLFGHKLNKIVLFRPDPSSGSLGFVEHSWHKNNVWQNVGLCFIGLSPILFGALTVIVISYILLPSVVLSQINRLAESFIMSNAGMIENPLSKFFHFLAVFWGMIKLVLSGSSWINLVAWFYLITSISCYMLPSKTDLNNAVPGIIISILILTTFLFFDAYVGVSDLVTFSMRQLGIYSTYNFATIFYGAALSGLLIALAYSLLLVFLRLVLNMFTQK